MRASTLRSRRPSGSAGARSGRPTTCCPTHAAERTTTPPSTTRWPRSRTLAGRTPRIRLWHQRARRADAQRGRAGQDAGHHRHSVRRPAHGRRRHRLERDRVRQHRAGRSVPRPRRLPRRVDPRLAPPVERFDRAVPRPLSIVRRVRVRAAAGTGRRLPIVVGGKVRGRHSAGGLSRGRLPLLGYVTGRLRWLRGGRACRGSRGGTGRAAPPGTLPGHLRRAGVGVHALAGSADEMVADVAAFRDAGVQHITVDLRENDPERVVAAMERFDREVVRPALADEAAGSRRPGTRRGRAATIEPGHAPRDGASAHGSCCRRRRRGDPGRAANG